MNTLLKFSAPWCANCKTLSKTLESINLGTLTLVEVDIDTEPHTAVAYNVRALPTLILLDETGEEIRRLVGAQTLTKEFLGIN